MTKPILGDLYGYESGSSTWTFQMPPSNGAAVPTRCEQTAMFGEGGPKQTFCGTLELDKEFLPVSSKRVASVSVARGGRSDHDRR